MTGFCGAATGRVEYSTGRVELYLEGPTGNVDGHQRPGSGAWFDESRVEELEDGESATPAIDARAADEREQSLMGTIETLQRLLEESICTCTLAKRCAKHQPNRPTIGMP